MSTPALISLLAPFGWSHRFDDLQKIGAGAMGEVWRAREIATGRSVALKLLDPARSGDEHTLVRLEIEGETLTRLREAGAHEHVVPILDFQITDEHACLVMEFIPGLNLKTWCETHRLPLRDRVKLIAQVAHAAGWFHGHGVMHRDLKPANILVSAITQQPVIVDFSIAKQQEDITLTLTNEALGTAPYMAPEQIDRARGPASPATDVYGIGATLYELLTQVHPHPGDLTQVVRRHAEEIRPAPPSALNPDIPRDLECIILKALSHRPADRYADGTALAEDLDRFLAGEPVKARPLPLATRLVRRMRRKPALTAALAACAVLGSFALWNWQRQQAQRQIFALESRFTTAMQESAWTPADLTAAESTLSTLAQQDTTLASSLRQRLHLDVTHDIEARLQQPHLRDEDFIWLKSTAAWLQPRLPEQAIRLQSLITDRAGRWETQAELRPPFAEVQGLFPRAQVKIQNGLLYPHSQGLDVPQPTLMLKDAVTLPLEIEGNFLASEDTFHHMVVEIAHHSTELEFILYRVEHASNKTIVAAGYASPDPKAYLLFIHFNKQFQRALLVPDTDLLKKPFHLVMRVERERAEATLNGRWSLSFDSLFTLGSSLVSPACRISWPAGMGLQHLVLRTRRADAVSPLEQADLLAGQGEWAAARRQYENLRGDPHFGAEAECKIAHCLWREGERDAARAAWEKFIPRPPSAWRDRSLLQLGLDSLLGRDWDTACRSLRLLPYHLPPSILNQLDNQLTRDLSDLLVTTSLGIHQPRIDPEAVSAITLAAQRLNTPPLALANRLGMPLHFTGQDTQARMLYATGLNSRDDLSHSPDSFIAVANCLDQWCRLNPSENDVTLTTALARWQVTINGQALGRMEQARVAARTGNLRQAIAHIRKAREQPPEKLDNRLHTSLWLLEGMLYRIQKDEAKAQQAWQKGRQIAATVTMRHPLHLFDSLLLHSLTQSWTRQSAGEVLPTLASRHLAEKDRPAAQVAFEATFLTDPAWLTTFNGVLQHEEGRKFAEDYVLCRQPPRELFQHLYRLLLEHYFLSTACPKATPGQTARFRQIVDTLVTEMAMNPRGEIAHLYAYLRAWNDPKAAKSLFDQTYPYSPALIEDMKWLLQQRQHRP